MVGSGAFQNGEALIYMAYVSAAVYDAVIAIEGGYSLVRLAFWLRLALDAAVVEAAYTVLRHYFPAPAASLDAYHQEALAAITDGPAQKEDGRAVGLAAAHVVIALRDGDGRLTPIATTSTFPTKDPGPGVWRLTPSTFLAPHTPWVGSVRPFILNDPGQFHPAPPPPLTSQIWVKNLMR